jgi:hypothetical protein
MDKPDVDLPTVDGIPIPPYGIKSQPVGPCTDKDMEHGLLLAIGMGLACLALFVIAVILKG